MFVKNVLSMEQGGVFHGTGVCFPWNRVVFSMEQGCVFHGTGVCFVNLHLMFILHF